MSMDFGLKAFSSDQLFIRYRPETPGFMLYRKNQVVLTVDRLLLHIDFPSAERDTVNNTVGVMARGTGVLQFSDNRPPQIVSREIEKASVARTVGFVLDVSSPYAVIISNGQLSGAIMRHVFASSFLGAKEAFATAYDQYKKVAKQSYLGIPVFDVYGWSTQNKDGLPFHKPRLQICGFVPQIDQPLSVQELTNVDKLRDERMEQYKLNRPRLGVFKSRLELMERCLTPA